MTKAYKEHLCLSLSKLGIRNLGIASYHRSSPPTLQHGYKSFAPLFSCLSTIYHHLFQLFSSTLNDSLQNELFLQQEFSLTCNWCQEDHNSKILKLCVINPCLYKVLVQRLESEARCSQVVLQQDSTLLALCPVLVLSTLKTTQLRFERKFTRQWLFFI